ncbi:uncharacterized protein AMSG_00011 [Thecamonas trahens ATCC 50062]|uniref:VTT domain-containing protein n=1 Tax=Thecamonas trahens ATCC 50062 TaxID=461836 RepID=A0A0L0D0Z0_THETB|nr:hypothetical protein AMSG_00011 [Thecamonas trahens ATCC 50062]KNC45897.1 hypothetical protein AMSG_00011 [Thecamonas trahens ATCC 50062]|eukprot:XP_013762885.1 hypothetical protein AMSG_00011 [Thecamonas trahens ATCC 50062]
MTEVGGGSLPAYQSGTGYPEMGSRKSLAFANPRAVNLKPFVWTGRLFSLLLLITSIAVLIWFSTQAGNAQQDVKNFVNKDSMQIIGMILLLWLSFLGTVVMSPPKLVFTGIGGFLFGYVYSVLIVWLGAMLGRAVTYFLGTDVLLDSIVTVSNNYPFFKRGWVQIMAARETSLSTKAGLIVALRMSSLFPDALLNYAVAMTPLPFILWWLVVGGYTAAMYTLYGFWGTTLDSIVSSIYRKKAPSGTFWLYAILAVLFTAAYIVIAKLASKWLNRELENYAVTHPEASGLPAPQTAV